MPRIRKSSIAALIAAALLATAISVPVGSASPRRDLLAELDVKYVRQVTRDLGEIGSTPLGFRVFGTPADQETANFLADEMESIGLEDVAVEELTGDGWLFKGATVHAQGAGLDETFKASSLGGVPGTGHAGVSGEIVRVGYGTAPEYEGKDVAGKIVFAWWDYDRRGIWPNYIAYEAHLHGAKAVIIASAPGHDWYAAGDGRALGSNDAECSTTVCAPMVVISKRSAHDLVKSLRTGDVSGEVTLKAKNLIDATGYQPIGRITGSTYPDKEVVFTAHQDAWFTSAADDSIGTAMVMAIAKAAIDSGYQPKYTWVFAPVTGEEYGKADAYYDWLQGAFHRITDSHTEWQSDAMAVLNFELHSPPYYLDAGVARELRPFLRGSLAESRADGLIPYFGTWEISSWNDGFTYTAEGAPAITFAAAGPDYGARYHTDYDSMDTLQFPTLAPVLEAETRVALDLDATLLPFDFRNRIANLGNQLDAPTMVRFGADAQAATEALERFTDAWTDAADAVPSTCSSDHLREATRISTDELTALSFGDAIVYPHQQTGEDLRLLDAAITKLEHGKREAAMAKIGSVDLNGLAAILSREAFDTEQLHHDPGYANISWGAQGQLSNPIDLYDTWHELAAGGLGGDFADQIADLEAAKATTLPVYRDRVTALTTSVNDVAAELEQVTACSGAT
ncbi:MAG TPA: M28 family peptidase [Actinomycetota bacterium]